MQKIINFKKYIPQILTILIICLMVFCSEIFEENEIIFPEIAAIATGSLLSPKFGWKTDKIRIFIFIMICAGLGVSIVVFFPAPIWLQLIVAYILSQFILTLSQTSFAPMISAIVLPVLLQTKSTAYLISAAFFTFIILISRCLLEKNKIKDKIYYSPLLVSWDTKQMFIILKRVLVVAILIFLAVPNGFKFIVAPPLLVAFTEFSNPESAAMKKPIKAIILISCCAFSGAICRLLLTMILQLPLTVSAFFGCLLMLLLIYMFNMFIPPASAMMLLAMLIPEESVLLYPLEVLIGISILMVAALFLFKDSNIVKDEF